MALIFTGFEIFGSIWLHLAPPGFELQKKQRLDQSKCRIWWSWSWSQEILAGAGAGARKFQQISNPGAGFEISGSQSSNWPTIIRWQCDNVTLEFVNTIVIDCQ